MMMAFIRFYLTVRTYITIVSELHVSYSHSETTSVRDEAGRKRSRPVLKY
jgi:hypothetical protein